MLVPQNNFEILKVNEDTMTVYPAGFASEDVVLKYGFESMAEAEYWAHYYFDRLGFKLVTFTEVPNFINNL